MTDSPVDESTTATTAITPGTGLANADRANTTQSSANLATTSAAAPAPAHGVTHSAHVSFLDSLYSYPRNSAGADAHSGTPGGASG
jgi:hypothetical protein